MQQASTVSASGLMAALLRVLGIVVGGGAVGWGFWILADALHLEWIALCLGAVAIAVVLATVLRPAWFWDHGKAIILRDLFGDRGAIALYLGISLGGLVVLSLRETHVLHQRAYCLRQLAAASNVHERVQILYGPNTPSVKPKSSGRYDCEELTHEHLNH